jgi:L-fucose isomerase-like protein
MALSNAPDVKLAIVGVSRDCFPIELTRTRLGKLAEACKKIGLDVYAANTIIESECDAVAALEEVSQAGANAAVVYLGNFGPEGPLSIFSDYFYGPVMACAAAEESKSTWLEDVVMLTAVC